MLHRLPAWLATASLALLVCVPASAAKPDKTSHDASQRAQFTAAYAAAQLGGEQWKKLARGLEAYPLYPYLQAAAMTADIGSISQKRVQAFLHEHDGTVLAHKLRRDYLYQVAGRKDWPTFRKMYRHGLGYTLACDNLRARLAAGEKLDFQRDLSSIWAKVPLPGACQPILDWAHKQGLLTQARLWQRIENASRKGHSRTITRLSHWLSRNNGIVARRLVLARKNPREALRQASGWIDSTHTRMAVVLAFKRLAVQDDEAADKAWHKLHKRFAFSNKQKHAVLADIALFNATDFEDDSLARLKQLPAAAQTDTTRTWRVRVALASGDWHKVLAAIEALPSELAHEAAWRYWHARALAELGHKQQARKLFAALAGRATYYGFLAADWIHQPYAICPIDLQVSEQQAQALLAHPGLARAFELHAVGLLPMARREWNWAMARLDGKQRRRAAVLATRHGWYDRAVFRFSSGRNLRRYKQRFPLAFRKQVEAAAHKDALDPAWPYAIIRAESAWVADAHSGADAYGLMQLLPSTGKHVAKRLGMDWHGIGSLYDASVNITLGTAYLAEMAGRFDGSPWLASAAYNAGWSKVKEWVAARGKLAPDVFIDTMPYYETRAYVHRVLAFSVIYDWRLNDKVAPMSARMPPIGTSYTPPNADSHRKAVLCPSDDDSPDAA